MPDPQVFATGGAIATLMAGLSVLTAFAGKLYREQEKLRTEAQRAESTCTARLDIHRKKQFYYERMLFVIERAASEKGIDIGEATKRYRLELDQLGNDEADLLENKHRQEKHQDA